MILTLSGVRALSVYLFPCSCSSRSSVWLCSSAALRPPRFMRWCGVLIVICPVVIFLYLDFWGFDENPFYLIFIFSRVTWWVGFRVLVKTLSPSCCVSLCVALWLSLWLCVYVVGYVVGVVCWFTVEVHGRSSRVEFMAGVGGCVVFFVVSLFNLYFYSLGGCGYVGTHHTMPTGHLSTFIITCIESKSNSNGVLCREITKTTKRHK